jgi:hypothetical protein
MVQVDPSAAFDNFAGQSEHFRIPVSVPSRGLKRASTWVWVNSAGVDVLAFCTFERVYVEPTIRRLSSGTTSEESAPDFFYQFQSHGCPAIRAKQFQRQRRPQRYLSTHRISLRPTCVGVSAGHTQMGPVMKLKWSQLALRQRLYLRMVRLYRKKDKSRT